MTQTLTPIEFHGRRATLLPLQMSHTDALFEAGQDERIWRYLPKHPKTRAEMQSVVENALALQAGGQELPFVVADRETDRIVGSTRLLDITLPDRRWEIGWTWYNPAVWRTRMNTECKYLLLRHSFETMDMVRVCLKTDLRNTRSQQAIERIGGVKEGVLRRQRIMPDGYIRDTVYYSIIAEEWPSVKARLESFLANDAQR